MNKIIIPQKLLKVSHQKVQLNKENNTNTKNPFASSKGHFVLPLTNFNKIYHDFEANFFKNLGINGILEINSNQDINLMITQCDPNEQSSTSDYVDFIPCQKLIFNADDPSLCFKFDLWTDTIQPDQQKLKELEINYNYSNIDIKNNSSLQKLTINSKKIYDLYLSCNNLKELNISKLDEIKSYSGYNEDINFENLRIPDKCKIILNKNLKWKFELSPSSLAPWYKVKNQMDIKIDMSLEEMIASFNPKSLEKNNKNSFSIRFDDFKNMITTTKLNLYKNYIADIEKKIKTQREITDSMIKVKLDKNINKEK